MRIPYCTCYDKPVSAVTELESEHCLPCCYYDPDFKFPCECLVEDYDIDPEEVY